MPEETVVNETPQTVAPVADTVISDSNINDFSSQDIETAINNFKEGKVKKSEPVVEAPKEAPVEALKVETPESAPEVKAPEVMLEPPKVEDFSKTVSETIEAKLKEFGIKKPEEVAMDKFYGYKTAEEFTAEYEKDPVGVFGKVVGEKVKQEMEAFKAEFTESVNPLKADLESRTINTHLGEAELKVKEMKDPVFRKEVGKYFDGKHETLVKDFIKQGINPYVGVAELVRAKNLANYEKSAYDRGVKETEARLAKAGRAVVEGSGKVIVDNESIDMETASSDQILAHLKRHGKA